MKTGHDATGGHECACMNCGTFPRMPRLHEGHVAVRFGDNGKDKHWQVLFEGQPITHRCVEANAGRSGWVIAFIEPKHICQMCRQDACVEALFGNVSVGREAIPV